MTPPTEKQSRVIWFALTALAVATVVALLVALVRGLGLVLALLNPVLWPLAVAAVVACLLSPLVDVFERRNIPRFRAILLVFAVAFLLVVGALASLIPQVIVETKLLLDNLPEYSRSLHNQINAFQADPPAWLRRVLPVPAADANGNVPSPLAALTDWLAASLPEIGSWLWRRLASVASGFGLLAGLALVPVYVFYFLLEQRVIESRWRDYLPLRDSSAKAEVVFVLESISQYLVAFFRGQVLVAICDAVLYTAGFLAVGLNYAFLLGCMALLLTMIPFLGAMVICATALLLSFVQYGDGLHPILVLAVVGLVQALEGLFISPKIMGNRVGLHPLVIIIAVMTGTTLLGGILGGLLAIPLAAALRVILFRYVWKPK